MRELDPQSVWINTTDAEARGIKNGDPVDIYNNRGRVRIPAKVTERIIPGTVSISEGAWYSPDKDGVDHGGCANILTSDGMSPGGCVPMNTAIVEIELAPKESGGKQ
jgi:anaerobic dimethyl sulfoxide reductase subunit A